MNKGYVSLYRKISENPIWNEKPFDKAHAWVDLIVSANYKKQDVEYNGKIYELGRGELIVSKIKLADRWGWSRSKVYRFFDYLLEQGMIENVVSLDRTPNDTPLRTENDTPNRTPKNIPSVTHIKLVNYSKFQDKRTPKNATGDTPNRTPNRTPLRTENDTQLNNNNKYINNLSYKNTNNARTHAREEREDENIFSFSTNNEITDEEYQNSELYKMMKRVQESRE